MIERRDMTVIICDEVSNEFLERYNKYLNNFSNLKDKIMAFHDPEMREEITEDSIIASLVKWKEELEEDFHHHVLPTMINPEELEQDEEKNNVISALFGNYLQDHMSLAKEVISTVLQDFIAEMSEGSNGSAQK